MNILLCWLSGGLSNIFLLTWQPAGLKGNRLQKRLAGLYFAAFSTNRTTIGLQNRQNLSPPSRIFASILQVRQAASGLIQRCITVFSKFQLEAGSSFLHTLRSSSKLRLAANDLPIGMPAEIKPQASTLWSDKGLKKDMRCLLDCARCYGPSDGDPNHEVVSNWL